MEILAKLGIDWKLLLAQAVNFAVLFFVLKHFAYGPLLHFMDERRKKIEQGLENAEAAKQKLAEASEKEQALLRAAREEAKALVAEAEAAARKRAQSREMEAEAKVAALLKEAESRMSDDRTRLINEARKEVAGLVSASLDKILGEGADTRLDEALIKKHANV
ncbi:MAG: F0F1 ATP synthase subunit B [Candidatus Moraniibacteriota bacterium]